MSVQTLKEAFNESRNYITNAITNPHVKIALLDADEQGTIDNANYILKRVPGYRVAQIEAVLVPLLKAQEPLSDLSDEALVDFIRYFRVQ